jgi:hypothetical protein
VLLATWLSRLLEVSLVLDWLFWECCKRIGQFNSSFESVEKEGKVVLDRDIVNGYLKWQH